MTSRLTDAQSALFDTAFGARSHVLLAVSGGADSTALLVLAAEWACGRATPALSVATVDHALRPEARAEAAAVVDLSARLGLTHALLDAPLADAGARVEENARTLRYEALVAEARRVGADAIATAHTLDDQAETVLMRLAAGSGVTGLAGMRAETDRGGVAHLRPFLDVPKADLVAALEARGLRWAEDGMNADDRFARARLRAARSALEREGLTATRLATLARRVARSEAAVEQAVEAAALAHLSRRGASLALDPAAAALPAEIRLRLLGRAVSEMGGGVVRLERLERLFERTITEPPGAATLAGARVAWKQDGTVAVTVAPPRSKASRRR